MMVWQLHLNCADQKMQNQWEFATAKEPQLTTDVGKNYLNWRQKPLGCLIQFHLNIWTYDWFGKNYLNWHQKLFELTDLKPEDLNPKGSAKVRGNYSRKVNGAPPVIGEKTEKSVPSEAEKVSRDKENNEVRVSIETPKEEDESLGGGFTDTK